MCADLFPELRSVIPGEQEQFYIDLVTAEVFRVDEDKGILTTADYYKYPEQIRAADRKELKQFIQHGVFRKLHVNRLKKGANVVDCLWVRVWKNGEVKSRLCARGCFDRQKQLIEKHSSTATRLSQRIICSQFMVDGIVHTENPKTDPIELVSLDISGAFLQGLDYEELMRIAVAP